MLICISIGLALFTAVLLFRLFFGGFPDFVEAFCRPNFSTLKVVIWAAVAIVAGIGAYRTVPRHFPQFAGHRQPKETVATATNTTATPTVVQARTSSGPQTNSDAPSLPAEAIARGVKFGDTVQISAIHPPVALRSATITSIDDTQLTVRATSGSYTILWKDVADLKSLTVVTNKPGAK